MRLIASAVEGWSASRMKSSFIPSQFFFYGLVCHFHSFCSLFLAPSCKYGSCPDIYKPYLAFASNINENAVGGEILYMAIDSLLYFSLIMLIEFGVFGKLYEKIKKKLVGNDVNNELLDVDVRHEQDRVDGQVKGKYTRLLLLLVVFPFVNSLIIMKKERKTSWTSIPKHQSTVGIDTAIRLV
jgi:hypothetical protein